MNKLINITTYFILVVSLAIFFLLYILLKTDVPTSTWTVYPSYIHFVPSIIAGALLIGILTTKLIVVKKFSLLDALNFFALIIVCLLISFVNEIYILFGTGAQILLLSFVLVFFILYSVVFTLISKR